VLGVKTLHISVNSERPASLRSDISAAPRQPAICNSVAWLGGLSHAGVAVTASRTFFGFGNHNVDGVDGRILGEQVPWRGSAADVFMQLQFPIHSGRIAGIPGRIIISAMGIAIALLSVTGVVIWAMKRARRRPNNFVTAGNNGLTTPPRPAPSR
jgi:hypothetical protein